MLSVTGWPATTDAVIPSVKVLHNGVERQVEGVTVQRELPSSFAQQVVGLGGLTAADGSIDWADSTDVETESTTSPFQRVGSWPPKSGDKVEISVGYNDAMAKALTGRLKDVSGSPFEQPSSSAIDFTGRLDRRVSIPPLQFVMPPLVDGGDYRHIGLYPTYFTDRLARVGGYNSTPPMSSGCVMSAPVMGSMWPERGTLTVARSYTAPGSSPNWRAVPWGVAVCNVDSLFTPSGGTILDRPMEITGMFDVQSSEAHIAVNWGGAAIRLRRSTTGAQAQLVNNAGTTTIAALPNPASSVVTLRVTPSGTTLTCTVRDAAGNEVTGTVAKPTESANNAGSVQVTSLEIGAKVGGVQVSFPSTAWTAVNYTRKAFLTLAAHSEHLVASPSIVNGNALDLLAEQSKAELAAMWIDQEDRLHWVNRNTLIGKAPVGTLTATDNLLDLPWQEDTSGVASSVAVTYREATAQRRQYPDLTLWEASTSGSDKGTSDEQLIHPDNEEDWVDVDTGIEWMDASTLDMVRNFNRGRGSWVALYAEKEDGTASGWSNASASCTSIDHETYKVAYTVIGFTESGWDYSLKIPSEGAAGISAGPMRRQPGRQTPVLRGKARTTWVELQRTASGSSGDAPELSHDAGWWVQDSAGAQALADFLSAQVATPKTTLRSVPIVPDSRIELADVYWLEDLTGLRIKGLVTGINQQVSGTPAAWDMDISVLVLSVETP